MAKVKLSINLFGGFSITDEDGADLTPRATKTQALVALLATSKHYRRSRAWLQDHLWSDREAEQASGSLRQTLHDLRKTLGDAASAVDASRTIIALTPDLIEVLPMGAGPSAEAEFLAGIDFRDPEFNDWLREMRAHYEAQAVQPVITGDGKPQLWTPAVTLEKPNPIKVRIIAEGQGDPDTVILETVLIEAIQRSLSEAFEVQFSYDLPSSVLQNAASDSLLVLRVQGMRNQKGERYVRASMETLAGLGSLWGETVRVPDNEVSGPENFTCQSLAHRATVAFAELLMENQPLAKSLAASSSDMMAASALRKMFTMRPDEVAEAGALLEAAIAQQNRGLYHAWLAQVHCIQHVEQQSLDSEALREKTDAHVRYALELEPMNSNVLAATANARLIFDNDTIQSGALARQSVTLNRSNPLCWFAWANANLYGGSLETAYAAAEVVSRIWWKFEVGVISG
ncbi:MAG: hypothetical protein OXC60_09855 [Litoreibacter sp.]|nr:hypothetical protein [Litoreibacter sp.]